MRYPSKTNILCAFVFALSFSGLTLAQTATVSKNFTGTFTAAKSDMQNDTIKFAKPEKLCGKMQNKLSLIRNPDFAKWNGKKITATGNFNCEDDPENGGTYPAFAIKQIVDALP